MKGSQMITLDKNYIKSSKYGQFNLEQRIAIAAQKVANGEVVSFRGASADTYNKVMQLANRIKLENEFPQCPCGECE
jgi:ASC-1-like (ASCH) protein